jgi:hypothetical protein
MPKKQVQNQVHFGFRNKRKPLDFNGSDARCESRFPAPNIALQSSTEFCKRLKTGPSGPFFRSGGNLCAQCDGPWGKIWYFRYYWAGKHKRMFLGSYPQISLKEARRRRDEARALVAQGINPYEHRKQQRRSVRNAAEHTFEAVFDQWVAFRRLSLKEGRQSTLSQILRIFKKDVLPTLGKRAVGRLLTQPTID